MLCSDSTLNSDIPSAYGLVGNMVLQHLDQPTFTNACITCEQDHVPLTSFDLLPTFSKKRDFRFSPH